MSKWQTGSMSLTHEPFLATHSAMGPSMLTRLIFPTFQQLLIPFGENPTGRVWPVGTGEVLPRIIGYGIGEVL